MSQKCCSAIVWTLSPKDLDEVSVSLPVTKYRIDLQPKALIGDLLSAIASYNCVAEMLQHDHLNAGVKDLGEDEDTLVI